ncbi:hypothetical protein HALLA_14310 [Halostagnicola larsenii XH-48]|uniref:Uncharacterized protein n=1 Tax=Halostagnicola larsenii XH-48 TaxID=797299 RepID=W0JUV5_9EURY|nr:hypothetical protein [Halostagnicola larsenii]AHG01050.1 hypothetical protein HALLA_14310 [Halostagnicola larsenii XH-48]
MTTPSSLPTTDSELVLEPERETRAAGLFPYDAPEFEHIPETARLIRFTKSARGILRSSDGQAGRDGSTACPDCGTETINGAGLFACSRCEWSGSLR